jgi:glutamine amidotransferase
MGNLRSVQKAFELLGCPATIVRTPAEVRLADRLILPGVGAFADAIAVLRKTGLADAVREFINTQRPFLGICLGLQLLMDRSYEDGEHAGLGVVAGDCVRFTVDSGPDPLKVPHMGWNSVHWQVPTPLFKDVAMGAHVYFVHSYHVRPADPGWIAATTDYGGPIVAAVCRNHVMATQFHPEKSQAVGRLILANFVRL